MSEITISDQIPPVYSRIKEQFDVDWDAGLIITYGTTIHVKGGIGLTKDLVKHESVHVGQQTQYAGGPDAWWERYFSDKEFRKEQEQEAYGVQLRCIRDEVSNPRKQKPRISTIVSSLSDMMTREEAIDWVNSIWYE